MATGQGGGFVFVHATATDSAGKLEENRRKVRQQVRKHVGNKWKNARLQSLEIRQVVIPQANSQPRSPARRKTQDQAMGKHQTSSNSIATGADKKPIVLARALSRIPSNPHSTDYAAARIRYNFDLNWLSALTISHVGSMRTDESLSAWIRYRERTFLDLVPSYYGRSQLLQRVVDSILAKAAHVLQPCQKTRKLSLWTFGDALRGVQAALTDPRSATSTDMLCAIRLLQIYELLDVTAPEDRHAGSAVLRNVTPLKGNEEMEMLNTLEGWSATGTQSIGSHAQGMQSLVTLRGPSSFKSELEKSLLCSLLENFWLRAYLSNSDYFLEKEEWKTFICSVFDPNDVIRHPVTLGLWITLAPLPRLLRQTNEIFEVKEYQNEARPTVQIELRRLRANLAQWISEYEAAQQQLDFSAAFYQELLGFGLGTLAITCRVLVALNPTGDDALDLEEESQALSHRTFDLFIEHIVSSGFFVGVCTWATSNEWRAAILEARARFKMTGEITLLDPAVFAKWNGMMGRKPHSERTGTPWRQEVDERIKQSLAARKAELTISRPFYTGVVWYL